MRIGVLCPSEIAIRRFMPALIQVQNVEFVGVGVNSIEERYGSKIPDKATTSMTIERGRKKAEAFTSTYGGKRFDSYRDVVCSSDIDAVYIPLPPALHYFWAKEALKQGKHVLLEKPATISLPDTNDLVISAKSHNLALHENYMFIFHQQLDVIEELINSGEIGEVRLYRISFGFPKRVATDFRYDKRLGGGALIDAGGYTIKYATRLLGDTAEIQYAHLNYTDEFEVDVYGSAALINKDGVTAQIAFGMDNDYKCELEIWGSKGTLKTGRVLTAPAGFAPSMTIKKNTDIEERTLPADDAFKKSIEYFMKCVSDQRVREDNYKRILKQAQLLEQFSAMAMR